LQNDQNDTEKVVLEIRIMSENMKFNKAYDLPEKTGRSKPCPLSAEPMPFDCKRIVYSSVGCLITKEK
jgi:hypothetical protein